MRDWLIGGRFGPLSFCGAGPGSCRATPWPVRAQDQDMYWKTAKKTALLPKVVAITTVAFSIC